MLILPLDWRAVLHVALYIRACDRIEIEACMARYDAADIANRVIAFSRFGGVAALNDETPVAVVSAAEIHPGAYQTGMFATDDWSRVAFGMTRWGLRVMKPAMLAAGGHRAECRSIADHHTAHRWLESLGFVREAVLPDCGKGRETFFNMPGASQIGDCMCFDLRAAKILDPGGYIAEKTTPKAFAPYSGLHGSSAAWQAMQPTPAPRADDHDARLRRTQIRLAKLLGE